MRQAGVLDVGCHSALLAVARQRGSAGLEPVFHRKVRLRLHESLDPAGRLTERGVRSVQQAVAEAVAVDPALRLPEVFAFATSVIRDAPNRDEVITRVAGATGIRLRVLPGEEEARLAYVAARQWAGPESGPLLVLDVGGGTVEIASGTAEQPDTVCSLPIGARRITRDWLPGGPPPPRSAWRRYGRTCASACPRSPTCPGATRANVSWRVPRPSPNSPSWPGSPSLAARRRAAGLSSALPELRACVPLLAGAGSAPGISRHRAGQSLAGAIVAEAVMEACGVGSVGICPWSTREGLLLERFDRSLKRADPLRES